MGLYINPQGTTKESWLRTHGKALSGPVSYNEAQPGYVVCLVDNGMFTAAGVGYCQGEIDAFATPDPRPKQWFVVPVEALREIGADPVEYLR